MSVSVSAPPVRLFWHPCVSYQCCDEPEQSVLFRPISLTEKCSDLDLGNMPSRRPIGLVFDKHVPGIGITREVPTVSVRTVVKFSDIQHGPLGSIVGPAVFLFEKHRQARIVSNCSQIKGFGSLEPQKLGGRFVCTDLLKTEGNDADADVYGKDHNRCRRN